VAQTPQLAGASLNHQRPGGVVLDLYDDWARLREVTESGCVLVRPDAHIGWRQVVASHDCTTELAHLMKRILGFA